jgi:hypothetical protein
MADVAKERTIPKIRRNEFCHCGSGKKYKKCCLDKDDQKSGRWIPTPEEAASITQFAQKMQKEVEEAKYAPPKYHEVELGGQKIRFVGRGIYPEQYAGQLSAAVIEHFKSQVLGKKWLEDEERKPSDKQHIVTHWLSAWDELHQQARSQNPQNGERAYVPLSGEAQELLALADDTSRILQLEKRFPEKLRNRLRNRQEFEGARYEIAVAGVFIRCNFNIEWIDDRTGTANKLGKRCEFNAVHKVTGETISVEAKRRRRQGTIHEGGEAADPSELRANIDDLYKKAVDKKPEDRAFAVFIDVNLPYEPKRQGMEKTWVGDVKATLEQYAKDNPSDPAPFSFLFATNFAWHFSGRDIAGATENFFVYLPETQTRFPVSWETFDAIGRAVKDYGKLPSGYLRTNSIFPLHVPDSAHHVTIDLTVSTYSQSQAMRGRDRTLREGYRSCYDAPHLELQPVEIPVLEGTKVKEVIGVWYEPIENSEDLDGFEQMDVAPRTDEHKTTHVDLLASSRRGVATETKIRVHILYEGEK